MHVRLMTLHQHAIAVTINSQHMTCYQLTFNIIVTIIQKNLKKTTNENPIYNLFNKCQKYTQYIKLGYAKQLAND